MAWVSLITRAEVHKSTDPHNRFASTLTMGRKEFLMFLRTGLDVLSLNNGISVGLHCGLGQFPLTHIVLSTTTCTGLRRAGVMLKFGPGRTVRAQFEGALTKGELDSQASAAHQFLNPVVHEDGQPACWDPCTARAFWPASAPASAKGNPKIAP